MKKILRRILKITYKRHSKSIGKGVAEGLLFVQGVQFLNCWAHVFSKKIKGVSSLASQSDQMFAEIGFSVS